MDQNGVKCKVPEHQDYFIEFICLQNQCEQESRYVCSECVQENIHHHNGGQPKLLKQKRFLATLEDDILAVQGNYKTKFSTFEIEFQKTLEIINQIEMIITQYKQQYQQLQNILSEQDITYFDYLRKLINEDFYTLTEENIKELTNLDQRYLNTSNFLQFSETQVQILLQTDVLYEQINNSIKNELEKFIDQKVQVKKYTEYFSGIDNQMIAFKKSHNNQYFAYISKEQIYVYDLFTNKQILNQKIDDDSYSQSEQEKEQSDEFSETKVVLSFSPDSQFLYVNSDAENEPLNMIEIKENFNKKFYSQLFRKNQIHQILPIDTNIVYVYTQEKKILKVQFYSPKILLTIQQEFKQLLAFIYDSENNVLITSDQEIQFWNGQNGELLFQDAKHLNIKELQIINNTQLLGVSNNSIHLWKINYKDKKLVHLTQQKLEDTITAITYVRDQQFLVVFGSYGQTYIFDKDLKLLKQTCIRSNEDCL
ncbi:hypothetical protein pb186bvf_007989 [Paramecium bursaria]